MSKEKEIRWVSKLDDRGLVVRYDRLKSIEGQIGFGQVKAGLPLEKTRSLTLDPENKIRVPYSVLGTETARKAGALKHEVKGKIDTTVRELTQRYPYIALPLRRISDNEQDQRNLVAISVKYANGEIKREVHDSDVNHFQKRTEAINNLPGTPRLNEIRRNEEGDANRRRAEGGFLTRLREQEQAGNKEAIAYLRDTRVIAATNGVLSTNGNGENAAAHHADLVKKE
jgi:hypothetical protein